MKYIIQAVLLLLVYLLTQYCISIDETLLIKVLIFALGISVLATASFVVSKN
ncbi:hypothetical protein [Poseidonibacter ostreae]|uniref:hypothetical protein n=1 Tax=Poseidonibacter ostreae TaxID=2654171 RepID=UPI00186AEBDD|nr:hypothetical protein [Poseidonibacter ostreae]